MSSFNYLKDNCIFAVNTSEVTATTSLARYVRGNLRLTGTKISCNQAGCGACVVTALVPDPATGTKVARSVNSVRMKRSHTKATSDQGSFFQCITPVLKCEGWEITTVEGLGDSQDMGTVPAALATFHGSQCGFCSPGMVMAMNRLPYV